MPAINPLPTPPSRNYPANFSDRADAFLAALPAYTSEANALLDDVHTSRDTVQGLRDEVMAAGLASAAANAATATTKAAEASASAAEAFGYLQTYRATSYGALANDPVVDPNGNPPTVGDEYFNTTMNLLKRFNGVTWQASDIATANLAAPSGSALVGFQQSGAGAVAATVQSKLRERISFKDFGAVGDGVTSDQASVSAAIASGFESVLINDNGKFLVTSLTNPRGVELDGHGHIVKAITGGLQKLNSYGDKHQYVFGREYLAAFHNLLIAQSTAPTRKPVMVFSGDSTTAGDGVSADYQIDDLLKLAGEVAGVQTPFGLSSINRGQSGKNTEQWRTTYLSGDLAENPDLLVLRWGINDPGWLKDGNPAPADAGQSYPNRRDVDDFLTSLRTGLETIRASRSVASLSIVLMAPNSTSDTPNGRDELWYEQIIPGIKQAARDFQCCFIDTYAYLRDSRPAAGLWMDNPYADGRAIHPLNVMNTWVSGLMASVIFPIGLRDKIGAANIRNISGADDIGDVSRLPSYYRRGVTISRAYTDWPLDGIVITVKSIDDACLQIVYPYRTAERTQMQFRMGGGAVAGGGGDSWGAWIALPGGGGSASTADVTPASGYTIPTTGQARAVKSGSQVICEGYITKTTPGAVAANTTVASLPAGFRPASEAAYWNAVIWDGTAFAYVVMRVQPDGQIAFAQNAPINMSRIWLNVSFSTLA